MKVFTITRRAGILLALGFFFACTASKPDVDDLINSNNFETALSVLETEITENPGDPNLYYKQGLVNLMYSEQFEVPERSEYYEKAMDAFTTSMEAGLDSAKIDEMHSEINTYWAQEHNAGTAAYEETDGDNSVSSAHFSNAIILKPQELSSYISLSTTLYANGKIDEAIETLNVAKGVVSPVPAKIYENLGFLYLQSGDPKQSIFYYELANKDISSNKNIAYGLVNAYISSGDSEKAIEILGDLADRFPNDAEIHNVYGTQLYNITIGIMDDLVDAYENNDDALADQIRFEAEGMGEETEVQLLKAHQLDATNTDYLESVAVFYNNMTGKYLEAAQFAEGNEVNALKSKAHTTLQLAIDHYEKLEELNPQTDSYPSVLENLKALKDSGL